MRIITLLTDFGTEDGYVGAMKGRIYSIEPKSKVIDISHLIPKYNVKSAAFNLNNYVDYFPEGTIHVAVIDPGVGSNRAPIIIKTDKFYLITQDNEIASFIIEKYQYSLFEIKTDWMDWEISKTFHGRDIFAPAAAKLASGTKIDEIAVPSNKKLKSFITKAKKINSSRYELKTLHIDHFGNIITNLKRTQLEKNADLNKAHIQIGKIFLYGIKEKYSDVKKGECLVLWNSSGYLEIAQNSGNAAIFLNLSDKNKLFFEF